MKRGMILNYNSKTFDKDKVEELILNVNMNQVYDKVGESFYSLERAFKSGTLTFDMVDAFLNDLDLRPVTASKIGYSAKRKLSFSGIKYSAYTDIFYKLEDGILMKFPAYKRNLVAKTTTDGRVRGDVKYENMEMKWEVSEFSDINGMTEFWVDATEHQMKKFNLEK